MFLSQVTLEGKFIFILTSTNATLTVLGFFTHMDQSDVSPGAIFPGKGGSTEGAGDLAIMTLH